MLVATGSASAAGGVTLIVHATNIRNDHGNVEAAVCTQKEFLSQHCTWNTKVPAQKGTVTLTLHDIPPGIYAMQGFHDENSNGKVDLNFLGFPTEGLMFSNDAPMNFGPPRFDVAAFRLTAAGGEITAKMRYF